MIVTIKSFIRHLFEYDRSRSQAGFGSKLELRLQKENITKDELWNQMENADPTSNKQYVNWLVKAFQEGSKVEDLISRGADGLKKYELLKKKRLLKTEHVDINKFKTLTDFEDVIEQYDLPEKKLIDRGNYEELYKTSTIRVLEIFDLAAACYYGKGTKWCTAADMDNRFEYYINKGPIFIILPLKPTYDGEKYQFWYDKEKFVYELKDEKDEKFKYKNLKSKFSDVIKFFNDLILDRIPDGELYKFFEFIDNPSEKIQLAAVSKNSYVISYIDDPSEKVQLVAVKKNGLVLQYIKNPSEEIQLTAVKQNGYVIQYIDNPSEKIQLAAISENGYAIQYIDNPSEKVQLTTVSENGYAIEYIDDPSEKVQLAAVLQTPFAIKYIENPSEKVQLTAIKQDKNSINYIEKPTERVLELSKK